MKKLKLKRDVIRVLTGLDLLGAAGGERLLSDEQSCRCASRLRQCDSGVYTCIPCPEFSQVTQC